MEASAYTSRVDGNEPLSLCTAADTAFWWITGKLIPIFDQPIPL
jgi:hypothetical protein